MSTIPWGLVFIAAIVLSMLVTSTLGASVPVWIRTSVNILWGVFALAFVVGIPLAFMNETRTTTPGGGILISMQTPRFLQVIMLLAIAATLMISVLGTAYIAVNSRATVRERIASGSDQLRTAITEINWNGVCIGIAVFVLGGVLLYLGGGIVITADGVVGGVRALVLSGVGLALLAVGGRQVVNSVWPKPRS